MRHLAFLAAIILLALPVSAQNSDVVGTAVLGGKRVELLSDRTWRFADEAQAEGPCVPINTVLTFCGSIIDWRPVDTTGTEFTRLFRQDSRTYGGIIYEEVGAAEGMDLEFMRNIIIENAAMGTGVQAQDIPIFGVQAVEVDGHPAETIIYGANFNGLDIIYLNTIVNSENHNVQFVVWTIGNTLTEEGRAAAKNFNEAARIDFAGGSE